MIMSKEQWESLQMMNHFSWEINLCMNKQFPFRVKRGDIVLFDIYSKLMDELMFDYPFTGKEVIENE